MAYELIYAWWENLNECSKKQGISFSNDFEVNFDFENKFLDINKKENALNAVANILWGEKIKNINLLIGKNGSGKSSILNLIALNHENRKKKLNQLGLWFVLYYLKDDLYVIEGEHLEKIKELNFPSIESEEKKQVAIVVSYKNGQFSFVEHVLQSEYREKIQLMYYIDRNVEYYFKNNLLISTDSNSKEVGFKRDFILSDNVNMADLYNRFVTINGFVEDFLANNVNLEINLSPKHDYTDMEHEYLYQGKKDLVLLETDINIFTEKKTPEKLTLKEKFIIKFLEANVISIVNRANSIDKHEVTNIVYKTEYKEGDNTFNNRLLYLEKIIKSICDYDKKTTYFSSEQSIYDALLNILEMLKKLDDHLFLSVDEITYNEIIRIDLKTNNEVMFHLLKLYDATIADEHFLLQVKFQNLSSGELVFVKHFSNLYKLKKYATRKDIKNVVLFLDEPDQRLHPEWSRVYFSKLIKFLNDINVESAVVFQLIVTTHSPFMVSDLPRQSIKCINIDENSNLIFTPQFGLMSNFYDLIKNNFFINYPVGEKAKEIFDFLMIEIDKLHSTTSQDEINIIETLIALIDDPLIKRQVDQYFNTKKQTFTNREFDLLLKRKQQLEAELAEIEIMEKELSQKND